MELVTAPTRLVRRTLESPEIRIACIGDIQFDGEDGIAHKRLLERVIDYELNKGSIFLGTGDLLDIESPSGRDKLNQALFYDSVRLSLDKVARLLEDELFDVLKDTKDRWLGSVAGHHYHIHSTGETSDTYLCQKLGAPFLGDSAFIDLPLDDGNKHTKKIRIWVHHGSGGGQKTAAISNWLENRAAYFDAQIMVAGHQSKLAATPIPFLTVIGKEIVSDPRWLIGNGGFLRGYMQGHQIGGRSMGSYVEKKAMPPVALGYVALNISLRRNDVRTMVNIVPEIHAF